MCRKLLPSIYPGEVLSEEVVKPVGLYDNALVGRLGMMIACVNEIANGRCSITVDSALRLACCFFTIPEFWRNLQKRYELEFARRDGGSGRCSGGIRLGGIEGSCRLGRDKKTGLLIRSALDFLFSLMLIRSICLRVK